MSAPPFRVKAVYDYSSPHEDDLSFVAGEIITVTEEEDADWYIGEYTEASGTKHNGLFPKNFVERFEPEAPPRPSRARPKKETVAADEPAAKVTPATEEAHAVEPTEVASSAAGPSASNVERSRRDASVESKSQTSKPVLASSKGPPPSISEKPSSFKDRIAAFNKPSAPPIAPKPTGPPQAGTTGFIKKPFVAPPPSRNAYIPPPSKEPPPTNIYRREEDPEIAQRQAQDQKDAEAAGLASAETAQEADDAPKAASLKDRIALLQKQQQEQAARRSEGAAKEKPKRPHQPRTESGVMEATAESETGANDPTMSPPSAGVPIEVARDVPRPSMTRKPSRDPRSPGPAAHDIVSDGNEADESGAGDTAEDNGGESTEVDDSDDKAVSPVQPPPRTSTSSSRDHDAIAAHKASEADRRRDTAQEEEKNVEEAEEEDDIDPETRRKMELRERMAKMSGGMGMPGMFGGGMPMPAPGSTKSKSSTGDKKARAESGESVRSPPPTHRQSFLPGPGMGPTVQSPRNEIEEPMVGKDPEDALIMSQRAAEEVPDVEDVEPRPTGSMGAPPPVPQGRPVPPPPPTHGDTRGPPPPIPGGRQSSDTRPVPTPPARPADPVTKELDSEEEVRPEGKFSLPARGLPPPVPGAPPPPARPEGPRSPPSHAAKRSSATIPATSPIPSSTPAPAEKRTSRVPPIPAVIPTMPPPGEVRLHPPPPPTAAPPPRQSTTLDATTEAQEDDETEYEGDYDTDIASGVSHKDALKAHTRQLSTDETTLSEEGQSSTQGSSGSVTLPVITPRAAPPPPLPPSHHHHNHNQQQASRPRQSMDAPRVAPPVPPARDALSSAGDEYDPYRYSGLPAGTAPINYAESDLQQESDPSLYAAAPPPKPLERPPPIAPQSPPPQVHAVPPPLPPQHQSIPPSAEQRPRVSRDMSRKSLALDPPRASMQTRRSMEQGRPSVDAGPMAHDIDIESTPWWAAPKTPPPSLQNRVDLVCEYEESTQAKRGGRTTVSRDVYVLYADYSQSTISARFDLKEPNDVNLEQQHQPPPTKPSQDALEAAHAQFCKPILAAAAALQGTSVEDGAPMAFVRKAIAAAPTALAPVGTRAFGALVYSNMANSMVSQLDEIRPGDIISFRNAKFQGKHGAMHQKYSMDVGAPEHVAVVVEWDGSKKKVRAWEQGRESKKVKVESFRVGDLRSGEVKVWRIMARGWIGWEGES